MSKIKPILPCLKEKKRYITYEVISKSKIQSKDVKKAINQGIKEFLGTYFLAKAGLMLIENNSASGVIKVNTKYVDHVKTALALIKEINKKQVIIKTKKVSGMINKAKKSMKGGKR